MVTRYRHRPIHKPLRIWSCCLAPSTGLEHHQLVSRREVFRRDNHICQYCGSAKRLTLDHIISRSKGGTHTWDNVVTACKKCNSGKGDRLLYETGMILKPKPKAPVHPAIAFAEQFWKELQPIES